MLACVSHKARVARARARTVAARDCSCVVIAVVGNRAVSGTALGKVNVTRGAAVARRTTEASETQTSAIAPNPRHVSSEIRVAVVGRRARPRNARWVTNVVRRTLLAPITRKCRQAVTNARSNNPIHTVGGAVAVRSDIARSGSAIGVPNVVDVTGVARGTGITGITDADTPAVRTGHIGRMRSAVQRWVAGTGEAIWIRNKVISAAITRGACVSKQASAHAVAMEATDSRSMAAAVAIGGAILRSTSRPAIVPNVALLTGSAGVAHHASALTRSNDSANLICHSIAIVS